MCWTRRAVRGAARKNKKEPKNKAPFIRWRNAILLCAQLFDNNSGKYLKRSIDQLFQFKSELLFSAQSLDVAMPGALLVPPCRSAHPINISAASLCFKITFNLGNNKNYFHRNRCLDGRRERAASVGMREQINRCVHF